MKRKRAALAAIPFYRKVLYSLLPAVFVFGSVEIFLLLAGHSLSQNNRLVGRTDPPPFPGVLPPGTPKGEPS